MNTRRRKSKTAAAAASSSQAENDSTLGDGAALILTFPSDVNAEALSALLPGESLESPTKETIFNVYRYLLNQALQVDATTRDLDVLRAEIEKKDVEIDQAFQDKENDKKELESATENVKKELKAVKSERDELAAAKSTLQTQLSSLSTSSSASTAELDNLKHRVEETDREKRDLVGVVNRLKEDCSQRDEEIKTLRVNLKQSRHDYQELETQVRELRSTETSSKFKLDSLTQQLSLAKEESERAVSELNSKSEEYAKYRRSKQMELSDLQMSHGSLSEKLSSTESTLKVLQSSHHSQNQQLSQALTRVQDLSGQLAEQEATYSSEASGLRRLVAMMEEREAHTKEIVDGIEREWAAVGDKAERRELKLKEEIDREARRADEAEKRVEELQRVFEKLDRGEFPLPLAPGHRTSAAAGSMPSTPSRNLSASDITTQAMMGLSPTVAMASRAQRTGKTFTEVYADYVKLQEEYARKCAECDHMDRTLQAVLAQIEERAPILSQQRLEYERLQSEASQLASQLASALSERDSNADLAQETAQKSKKILRENELLESQLDDLGQQVQTLLREVGRSQDPTIPIDEELEADPSTAPPENIQEVITNNLVRFRSIQALQEQNQKLLKIVRDLGAKMESEEREYKEALEREQTEAVMEAHQAIQKMQEDLDNQRKSSELTIQAYMKERDALKNMLSRAEQRVLGMTALSGANRNLGSGPTTDSELEKELAEVQNQFEAYKTEMGIDSIKLHEDLMLAQKEAAQRGADLGKANANIGYLNDRHRMVQEQFAITSRELENVTQRNAQLYDQYRRADIEHQRVTEDLLNANNRLDKLRNECANLRAEKNIWESVQVRLVDENKALAIERSHLSDLMANVQKMHNDLERSGENDRRRLESQIQMLEGQTQDLRTQLTQERDSIRHVSLQKEIEVKELQTRVDRSVEELSKTREALVEAETSRKHLEERVQESTRQLRGNEEKLAVFERRSTLSNGIGYQAADDSLTREQQLESEVAELRSALKVAEVDLANARSHVQQFQEISQANEEALSSLNATYDEFRSSTESQIAKHESDYASIQDKLQSVQDELARSRETLVSLQQTLETERRSWTEDKRLLEDTIADMTTSEKSVESDRASRQTELRQLEDRAKAAEDKYSREVVAHADAIKAIEDLKHHLSSAKAAARDGMATAETATAKLSMSESSWKQQKDTLDKELADLNKRCKDLVAQNSLLHNHLESVSSQATRIREATNSSTSDPIEGSGESLEDPDKLSELRSVVAWLRKEKDIVELQLELCKQENSRLKLQVDHLSQSLDQTRAMLSEERERVDEAATSQAEHELLVNKINELTVFRESNATLRADGEAKAKRMAELDSKLQHVNGELGPLKQELLVTKAELEARDSQVTRLQEDSRKWQERNSQLMSKYDRIDPVELQAMKDELEKLRSQQSLQDKTEVETFKKQIETLETKLRESRELAAQNQLRVRQQMSGLNKDKSELNTTITQLKAEIQTMNDSLKAQNSNGTPALSDSKAFTDQIKDLQNEKAALEASLAEARSQAASEKPDQTPLVTALQKERDALLAEKNNWIKTSATDNSTAVSSPDESKAEWETEKVKLVSERDAALAQSNEINAQMAKMKENLRAQYRQSQNIQQKVNALEAEKKISLAKQEEAIQAAVNKAKSEMPATGTSSTNEELIKRHAEELKNLEERLKAAHKTELNAAAVAAARQVVSTSSASEGASKGDIDAAVAVAKAEWDKGHQTELDKAVESGRMEQATKTRIKDSQLMKSQSRVKELEAQILALTTTANSPSTSSAPAPEATTVAGPSTQARPVGRGGAQIRGRGAARPMTAASGGRGGAPAAPPAGGVSIMGAAKRPREEGESEAPATENSLAKRLKPADEIQGKPGPIRRIPPKA